MLFTINAEKKGKGFKLEIESNGISLKPGNLTDFERRMLEFILNADAKKKEAAE